MKTRSLTPARRLGGNRAKRLPKTLFPGRGLSNAPQGILVPVDFSPESIRALKYAAVFAKQSGAAITVLHAVEPIHEICDFGYGPVTRDQPNERLLKTARGHLRTVCKRYLTKLSNWEAIVRSGSAFTEIIRTARELGIDLILMSTRGLTDSKDVPVGSTAERVVRHSPCPVLTLRKPASIHA